MRIQRKSPKRVLAVVAAAAVYGAFSAAHAQTVSAAVQRQAEARMAHGLELRAAGRDEDALADFTESYRLNPEPRAAAQLGLVNQALGQWLAADRLLREALAAEGDRWVQRNRAALDGAHAIVRQHVGRLEVRGGPAGAEVYVAGERAGVLPLQGAVSVLAGVMTVEVRAAGYVSQVRRVDVTGDELAREEVTLRLENGVGAQGGQSAGTSDQSRAIRRSLGIVGLVGGGVFLAGGAVANGLREGWIGESQMLTVSGVCRSDVPRCQHVADQTNVAHNFMIAGYVTGGILTGTGIGLFLSALWRRSPTPLTSSICLPNQNEMGITCTTNF